MLEIALTGGLVSVILGTSSQAQNVGSVGALGVGGYVALAGLWAAPVSVGGFPNVIVVKPWSPKSWSIEPSPLTRATPMPPEA